MNVAGSETLLHLFTSNLIKLLVRDEEGGKERRPKDQGKCILVRQVMQKQVRLFLNQMKERNALVKEERNLKGSKRVRTKQNEGVRGTKQERERVGTTD